MIMNISIVTVLNPHILSFGLHHKIAVRFKIFHPCGLIGILVRGRITAYRMAVILLSVSLDIPHCLIQWKNWGSDANDWVSFKSPTHLEGGFTVESGRLRLSAWGLVKWLDKSSSAKCVTINWDCSLLVLRIYPLPTLSTRAFRDFNSPNEIAWRSMQRRSRRSIRSRK